MKFAIVTLGAAFIAGGAQSAVLVEAVSFTATAYGYAATGASNSSMNAMSPYYDGSPNAAAAASAVNGTVSASAASAATLNLLASGGLTLQSTVNVALGLSGPQSFANANGSAQTNYVFTLDQAYRYRISNTLTTNSSFNNLNIILRDRDQNAMAAPLVQSQGSDQRPLLTGTLAAGRYTIFFAHIGGSTLSSGQGSVADGISRNRFNFVLSPLSAAPEPATWALLISGFGLVGAAARRRYPRAATM